jgi:toxin YoeB
MRKAFTEQSWNEYLFWQNSDKTKIKKINKLIKSIERDGLLKGEGKPEFLKHNKTYSRRIDGENRLTYTYENNVLIIHSCKGHY